MENLDIRIGKTKDPLNHVTIYTYNPKYHSFQSFENINGYLVCDNFIDRKKKIAEFRFELNGEQRFKRVSTEERTEENPVSVYHFHCTTLLMDADKAIGVDAAKKFIFENYVKPYYLVKKRRLQKQMNELDNEFHISSVALEMED